MTELPAQAAGSPLLLIDDLSFSYGSEPVLDGVSLGVEPGSIVGVVGPSGCGKSTLLSLVAGLITPLSGRIEWANDASGGNDHQMSMMFQSDTLLPWLTVSKNVGFHSAVSGKQSKKEGRDRAAELIEMVGLADAAARYPYQLSGGMRRRTAFATALAPSPRTLLLDEPFSALDEPTRIAIHQDVHQILRKEGVTTLLITHDLGEAISLCDYVVVMTARPAQVAVVVPVPLGQDREMLSLREEPMFLELYGRIWELLAKQIQQSITMKTA